MIYHAYLLVIKTEQKTGHILGPIKGKTKKGGAHTPPSLLFTFLKGARGGGDPTQFFGDVRFTSTKTPVLINNIDYY